MAKGKSKLRVGGSGVGQIIDTNKISQYETGKRSIAEKYNDPIARGTNLVKTDGELHKGYIDYVEGSYDTFRAQNGEQFRERQKGYITERNGRLYGFTDNSIGGYKITDLRTGTLIGETKNQELWSVKESILTFQDAISHKANKERIQAVESQFNSTRKRGKYRADTYSTEV